MNMHEKSSFLVVYDNKSMIIVVLQFWRLQNMRSTSKWQTAVWSSLYIYPYI